MKVADRKDPEKYRRAARIRQRRARAKLRTVIQHFRSERGCADCGEAHPACLQFHHRDPATKSFTIGSVLATKKSVAVLRAELEKCDVLCSNCHLKRHWQEDRDAEARDEARLSA